ncbi:hypothetical protein ACFL1Z_03030 [Thermodesulfobacteriota bacterium]
MITLELRNSFINSFNIKAELFYQRLDIDIKHRRLVGGIAWPGAIPGFGIVIVEEWVKSPSGEPMYSVLEECEAQSVDELLDWVHMMVVSSPSFRWDFYGDIRDNPAVEFIWQINDKFPDQRNRFSVIPAPHVDNPKALEFYMNVIRRHLNPEKKSLRLRSNSKIPAQFPRDLQRAKIEDHPAIAALGYGLSALTVWRDTGLPRYARF